MTNSPADGMNTRMLPAITPGMLRGNVTRQNVCQRLAPRSCAASFKLISNFSRAAYSGRTINGRYE